jgi:hypothetical protein
MMKKTILTVVLLLVALALLMLNFTSGPTACSGTVAGKILANAAGSRLEDVSNLKRCSLDVGGIERIFPAYQAIINSSPGAEVVDFAIEGARTHLENRLSMGEQRRTLAWNSGFSKTPLREGEISCVKSLFNSALANRAKWRNTTEHFLVDYVDQLKKGGYSQLAKDLGTQLNTKKTAWVQD